MSHDDLILDRYEPIGTAGEGGFGTVQIAWDPRIQRKVAIKTIKLTAQDAYRAALPGAQAVSAGSTAGRWHGATPWNEFLEEGDAASESVSLLDMLRDDGRQTDSLELDGAFPDDGMPDEPVAQVTSLAHLPGLDEARTAAMLADPRIVTVYDFEVRGRYAYLIMEYVEGITLTHLLYDYPDIITLDMVAAVFDSVAGALEMAHGAGVLHLDIKPDNILINPAGQVKVTDFGLATLADASGLGTTGGGTIGYMPLEQMRREHLDARTDEWSLAAVAYEMLSGSNPFRARNLAEAESAIEDAELVLPSLCWRDLDAQIDDVIFYALDPDRDERYDTVADFAEEMDKFLGDAEEGREQLSLVVADALGYDDGEEGEGPADETEGEPASPPSRLLDLVDGILALVARPRQDELDYDYEEDDYEYRDAPDESVEDDGGARVERREREPLAQRVPKWAIEGAARAFGAASSGFLAFFSLSNMPALHVALGGSASVALGALTVVVAVVGAAVPHAGALVALCLLAIALVLCAHPVLGAGVLVATIAWWYMVGHRGKAGANTVLSQPLLGAVGASSAVPFVAGASLEPLPAIGTTLFSAALAVVFASFGSGVVAGWDAPLHWSIAGIDITRNFIALVMRASTWVAVASWVVAACVLSLACSREGRALKAVGIVAAAAIVLAGTLAFTAASPQLVAPVVAAAMLLLVVVA